MPDMTPFHLVLASSSPYRKMLLERFNMPFFVVSPLVDETPLEGERPDALVVRLAEAKARAGAALFLASNDAQPRAQKTLVIGSDQVADYSGVPIGKPHDFDRAWAQLKQLSGQTVVFRTGLSLFDVAHQRCETLRVDVTTVYRQLSDEEIVAYLKAAEPYQCAGAIRSEDLGIALLDKIESDDPTALIGLPLIALARLMRAAGVNPVLGSPKSKPLLLGG
ncbi:MAG: Maf family nucleotide pyrophosphatase [Burkholderiales bacterium]|jgi:septum formation protein|nr:Maf family nucleotide pyrophosphatase [Burkholderiales bacterium]